MQIIRAATAKSDWRRRACDFAVVDSPLSPPPAHARTYKRAKEKGRGLAGFIDAPDKLIIDRTAEFV